MPEQKSCKDCTYRIDFKLQCRRHAPSINGFPEILFDDWCGDYEKKAIQQTKEYTSTSKEAIEKISDIIQNSDLIIPPDDRPF
jgi:hypothetical protein